MRIGRLLGLVAGLLLSIGQAFAVDVNTASKEALQSIKGIGPALSERIIDERRKGAFKNLDDLESRVKGIGEASVRQFAASGLTVGRSAAGSRATATPQVIAVPPAAAAARPAPVAAPVRSVPAAAPAAPKVAPVAPAAPKVAPVVPSGRSADPKPR